jgi:hypothetical protein
MAPSMSFLLRRMPERAWESARGWRSAPVNIVSSSQRLRSKPAARPLNNLGGALLANADPADRRALYDELGVSLTSPRRKSSGQRRLLCT